MLGPIPFKLVKRNSDGSETTDITLEEAQELLSLSAKKSDKEQYFIKTLFGDRTFYRLHVVAQCNNRRIVFLDKGDHIAVQAYSKLTDPDRPVGQEEFFAELDKMVKAELG